MRSMDYIGISQTIGRVIRMGDADKVFGLVCVPVYSNVGITTARKVGGSSRYYLQQRTSSNNSYYTMSRIVLVTGGFDPIHSGHIAYFKNAKELYPETPLCVGLKF